MSDIFAAVLMFGGPILAAVCVIGVVALVGLVGYDVVASRRSAPAMTGSAAQAADRKTDTAVARMYIERGVARGFVILGAAFWGICVVAASLWSPRGNIGLLLIVLIPFLMNLASLVIGWRWERTASVMLVLTSVGVVLWGIAAAFEPGVWAIYILLLIGPMMTAGVLFWLARQGEIDLALRLAIPQELVPVAVRR